MFIPESIDDAKSELGRKFLPNHLEWQGTKVERKGVEERAGSRELIDMAGDVYPNPSTSVHHVCAALMCVY